jgi:DNA-binding MarR family transcriptional regulator
MSRPAPHHVEAWRGVLAAHSSVVDRVEKALADEGLPRLAWYDVLWALREAPARRLRMSELADRLTVSRGGLTQLADRLEEAGLLRREACATDRRGFDAVLTADGERLLRKMWPVYARVLAETFGGLGEREARAVTKALRRVRSAALASSSR